MREVAETLDDRVEDLVRAEAGGVLEPRLDNEPEVAVPALQAGDDVAAAEGDGEQVRRHLGDVRRRGQTGWGGGAELEDADEAVPEHDGRQDDAVEAAPDEEAGDHLALGWLGCVDGEDDRRAAGHGAAGRRILAELPAAAIAEGVPAAVAVGNGAAPSPSIR